MHIEEDASFVTFIESLASTSCFQALLDKIYYLPVADVIPVSPSCYQVLSTADFTLATPFKTPLQPGSYIEKFSITTIMRFRAEL